MLYGMERREASLIVFSLETYSSGKQISSSSQQDQTYCIAGLLTCFALLIKLRQNLLQQEKNFFFRDDIDMAVSNCI